MLTEKAILSVLCNFRHNLWYFCCYLVLVLVLVPTQNRRERDKVYIFPSAVGQEWWAGHDGLHLGQRDGAVPLQSVHPVPQVWWGHLVLLSCSLDSWQLTGVLCSWVFNTVYNSGFRKIILILMNQCPIGDPLMKKIMITNLRILNKNEKCTPYSKECFMYAVHSLNSLK